MHRLVLSVLQAACRAGRPRSVRRFYDDDDGKNDTVRELTAADLASAAAAFLRPDAFDVAPTAAAAGNGAGAGALPPLLESKAASASALPFVGAGPAPGSAASSSPAAALLSAQQSHTPAAPRGDFGFVHRLWDRPQLAFERARLCRGTAPRVEQFLVKLAACEEAYAQSLARLCAAAPPLGSIDEGKTLADGFNALRKHVADRGPLCLACLG